MQYHEGEWDLRGFDLTRAEHYEQPTPVIDSNRKGEEAPEDELTAEEVARIVVGVGLGLLMQVKSKP